MVMASGLPEPVAVALLEVKASWNLWSLLFDLGTGALLTAEALQNHLLSDTNLALVLVEPRDCTRICAARAVVSLLDPAVARPTDVETSTRIPSERLVPPAMLS